MFPQLSAANHNAPSGIRLVIRTTTKCPEKDEYPQQNMNEEYFLQVAQAGDAILEAEEVWGILRGLETFSQLIFQQNGQVSKVKMTISTICSIIFEQLLFTIGLNIPLEVFLSTQPVIICLKRPFYVNSTSWLRTK
jgi:hypothetical protein